MVGKNDEEIADVMKEAQSPRNLQKKLLTVERKRKFRKAALLLANPKATFREFVAAIREIEPDEQSSEFVQAVNLWHEHRGRQ